MNYEKELNNPRVLKVGIAKIVKDINKRINEIQEGAGEGGSAEQEALIAELQAQITALTPPKTRVYNTTYFDLTDTTITQLNGSVMGVNNDYFGGGGLVITYDGSNLISNLLPHSSYRDEFLDAITISNFKINDTSIEIHYVSKSSDTSTSYPQHQLNFTTNTTSTDDGYISNVPIVAEGNIISIDLTNTQTNETITLIGTFDVSGTTIGAITTTVLSDESE